MSAFIVVGAVCLLWATTALRRRTEFPGVVLLVPVVTLFSTAHATAFS